MARRAVHRPQLVVAGPGAGKTHAMVEQIAHVLPSVSPSRYLAAATFTNSATASIRERLHHRARVGPNVFVGTLHAFLNRFIVAPFARVYGLLQEDRTFGAINVNELVDEIEAGRGKRLLPQERNSIRGRITRSLLLKGVVPYDEIIGLSCDLLEKSEVRGRVSRRLQFLFVDEFQDTDTRHLKLFEHIRKEQTTKIHVVGDPEQFVYGFTYAQRGLPYPQFEKIPFFRFRAQSDCSCIEINYRSCEEIVSFTNNFHGEVRQRSSIGFRGEPRVLFLGETELVGIVRQFQAHSEAIPHQRGPYRRLFLGFKNATYDIVREEFGIRPISNGSRLHSTLLQDALEILALCRGEPQRKTRESLSLSVHEWRKLGILLLRELRDSNLHSGQLTVDWFGRLRIRDLGDRACAVGEALTRLEASVLGGKGAECSDWSSSIHQAKGLEATSVLVLASSRNELKRWLITDRAERNVDKQDKCRLGFVAFSRAMELLCIGCCQPLDAATRSMLAALGVAFIPGAAPTSEPRGARVEVRGGAQLTLQLTAGAYPRRS